MEDDTQLLQSLSDAISGLAERVSPSVVQVETGWWGVVVEDAGIRAARLNPGYSGGPLVDASGKMIGMNVAYASSRGIAVPVSTLKGIASKLSREGKIRRSCLGIAPEPISLPKE